MTYRLRPIAAAMLITLPLGAAGAFAATEANPQIVTSTRTIVIDNGMVVENTGGDVPDIVIAQAPAENVKKQVRIVTSGHGEGLPGMHHIPDIDVIVSSAMSEAFAGLAHGPMARTVKNAPYSAEVVTEKIQPLPDGNQISKRTSAMTFRDSAGRTRQEMRDARGGVKSIHIHDTVEGTRLVLSPSSKSATKLSMDKEFGKHIAEIKDRDRDTDRAKSSAREAKDARAVIVEHPGPGQEIIVKRVEMPPADGKKEIREEIKVNVVRAGSPGSANVQTFSFSDGEIGRAVGESMRMGPIGMSFQDGKWSAKSTTTPLGSKDIEGVRVEGKSVSYTIPAGEIGNRNPITVTTESWYSPDLQATVYSKSSDPRVGETIYRLANIKRGEQPASLFAVPEGFSVKELPGMAFSTKTR